jgi:hypothetical protein
MWQGWQSVVWSVDVVFEGLAASNHDQAHPLPQSLFCGWLFLPSLTMTNQPDRVFAWLTVPVVIGLVTVIRGAEGAPKGSVAKTIAEDGRTGINWI